MAEQFSTQLDIDFLAGFRIEPCAQPSKYGFPDRDHAVADHQAVECVESVVDQSLVDHVLEKQRRSQPAREPGRLRTTKFWPAKVASCPARSNGSAGPLVPVVPRKDTEGRPSAVLQQYALVKRARLRWQLPDPDLPAQPVRRLRPQNLAGPAGPVQVRECLAPGRRLLCNQRGYFQPVPQPHSVVPAPL
jgi:hypothetical protein